MSDRIILLREIFMKYRAAILDPVDSSLEMEDSYFSLYILRYNNNHINYKFLQNYYRMNIKC